jgi:hypothetical protein
MFRSYTEYYNCRVYPEEGKGDLPVHIHQTDKMILLQQKFSSSRLSIEQQHRKKISTE